MARALKRLTSKLYNTPQLITSAAADEIQQYLAFRNSPEFVVQARVNKNFLGDTRTKDPEVLKNICENGIAILDVDGPLSYQVSEMAALCGAVSYEQLQYEFDAACDSAEVHTIVQYIDSPGGEAYGCFEFSNYMRKKAKEKGKRLITYVDGGMYSAALALGVASEEIITNPFADQGSIGVLIRLMNTHKFNKKMGLEETFVFAGEEKIPYDKEGNFKKEFIDDLQTKVDGLYAQFVTHVATCRGMTEASVIGTKAKTFSSSEALKLGLVDKVMEREEFFNYLADGKNSGTTVLPKTTTVGVSLSPAENISSVTTQKSDEDNLEMNPEQLAALELKLKQLEDANKALTEANATLTKETLEKAKSELKAKLSSFSFVTAEVAPGLTDIVSKLQDSERAVVMAVFGKAKEELETSNKKITDLETELNSDLFKTVAHHGEVIEDSTDTKDLKSAVSKKIKAKLNGDKK